MTTRSDLPAARAFLRSRLAIGDAAVCAVSGGLDSMCLLHFLTDSGKYRITAAHFNHRLRGGSADRDEAFVRDWCAAQGVAFLSGAGDVRALAAREHLTIEEAGRQLRYAYLEMARRESGSCWILTAHHADDSAETMLLNLIRGTGIRGLAGIPPERGTLLRPFLSVTREELAAYAAAHGVPHVEDESNALDDAARNVLRHQVFPVLKTLNPRASEHMASAAELLRRTDGELESASEQILRRAAVSPGAVSIAAEELSEASEGAAARAVLGLFDLLGAGCKDVGRPHLTALRRLYTHPGEAACLSLPHGVRARTEGGRLFLELTSPLPEMAELTKDVPLIWGNWVLTLRSARDGEGLALRVGEAAEKICVGPAPPAGRLALPGTHGGGRTVKRLCLDRGIPPFRRDGLPALYVDGCLAAVWGLGVDEKFAPTGDSCRFIQIITKSEESSHEK